MKRKTSTTNKRHALPLLTAAMILIMATLTSCSSAEKPTPAVEESKPSTPSTVETVKPTEEVVASSEAEVAPEPTVESTPEPTIEAVVYEGIDMESDLPGEEWIATFEGVIDEPKIVVYNDATNKKVIVENGGEVQFATDDALAIYRAGAKIVDHDLTKFNEVDNGTIAIFSGLPRKYSDSGDSFEFQPILEFNGEEIVYKITVNVQ